MSDPLTHPSHFYNRIWSSDWDQMKTYGPASRHVANHVISLIKGLRFQSVFDVGCGDAVILFHLHQLYPTKTFSGSELVGRPLIAAQKRLPQATFYQNNITRKPPTKKRHDLVLAIDVLEHIENDRKAIANLRKLTQKYLLIVVPLGPLWEIEYQKVGHVHGYSKFEIDWKLKRTGFKLVQYHQWGFPFYNLYRRLLHHLPSSAHGGQPTLPKRLASEIFYFLLSLSLTSHPWGERYIALYQVI